MTFTLLMIILVYSIEKSYNFDVGKHFKKPILNESIKYQNLKTHSKVDY